MFNFSVKFSLRIQAKGYIIWWPCEPPKIQLVYITDPDDINYYSIKKIRQEVKLKTDY